jgi:N-acetylgalactosamine-6-sulfatase
MFFRRWCVGDLDTLESALLANGRRMAPRKHAPFHWVTYAVVDQQWKLLSNHDGSHMELYDIAADPLETKDLASDKPDVVKEIVAMLEQWKSTLPEKPSGEVFSVERSK